MRYKVEVTFDLEVEVAGDMDEEQAEFFFEEHRCANDYVDQIVREAQVAQEKSSCICYKTRVEYLGRVEPSSPR